VSATEAEDDQLTRRLKAASGGLSANAQRIAEFIDENRALVVASSALELGRRLGTSDATVIRVVKALGFDGLPDLKRTLAGALDGRWTGGDTMRRTLEASGEDAAQTVRLALEGHAEALAELQGPEASASVLRAVGVLNGGVRIAVYGAGRYSHLAGYLKALLLRSGREGPLLDATGVSLADQLAELRDGDVLLALGDGRFDADKAALVSELRRLGLKLVVVAGDEADPLAREADVVVLVRRRRASEVALNAVTLAALEAIVLGLAACDAGRAVDGLQRLNRLRRLISEAKPARR
jgi:DNA-binding MurR/RpiR family transcriptional regulator